MNSIPTPSIDQLGVEHSPQQNTPKPHRAGLDHSMNQVGTQQYARQNTPKPQSAGLAHAGRAPRGQASQIARPVSATGPSSSMISSNPKYRLNGPAPMKNFMLNPSAEMVDPPYPKGQKYTPKNAAQANTWAIIGGNMKRFIRNIRRTSPFNPG